MNMYMVKAMHNIYMYNMYMYIDRSSCENNKTYAIPTFVHIAALPGWYGSNQQQLGRIILVHTIRPPEELLAISYCLYSYSIRCL